MIGKCPSCNFPLGIGGWRAEEMGKGIETDIQATALVCNKCKAVIGIIPK